MASSSRNGEHRAVHQDYIARIRFSNALPPPPNPPKLLDIPNTGLASGLYTAPGFASRLAREQPLNIEADAELGMPLDLVGMPGIFDGDESSIQAPTQAPQPHPHDKPLLRPVSTLGKPKLGEAAVSFLRRTEYISSVTNKTHGGGPLRNLNSTPNRRPLKRRSPEPDRDSPAYVKRKIDQSFIAADQTLKDKTRVRHPTKRNVKLTETFPLLPDLDAFPDSGAYVTIKFMTNPVSSDKTYDTRLLNAILKPIEQTEAEEAALRAAEEAYRLDPVHNPKPDNRMNYDFYLNDGTGDADKFRQRFDVHNPSKDDDQLYTTQRQGPEGPCFSFSRVRAYETAHESELDQQTKYDEELILALDNGGGGDIRTAYYYPVMQRSTIRPQRTKNIQRTIGITDEDEQIIDQLDVVVDEPTEEIRTEMDKFKDDPYGLHMLEEEEEAAAAAEAEAEAEDMRREQQHANGDGDDDEAGETNGHEHARGNVEELDAEGEED